MILSVYGLVHLYVFNKLARLMPDSVFMATLFALILVVLAFSPFLVVRFSRAGHVRRAVAFSWAGYLWMGFVFLFLVFSIPPELYRDGVNAAGGLFGFDARPLIPGSRELTFTAALLALITVAFGLGEARRIRTVKIDLETSKMKPGAAPLRIVQISDVHLGVTTGLKWFERVGARIEGLRPDRLVSTGDMLDIEMDHLDQHAAILARIEARLGKFAVSGNHEAYAGNDRAVAFKRSAGFNVLARRAENVNEWLTIAGVDDPAVHTFSGKTDGGRDEAFLRELPAGRFILLLKHQPDFPAAKRLPFDLQLSGHTHDGQIFPFGILVRFIHKVRAGLTPLGKERWLYVSRGTGTWGPPIRFLAPPEITVITLRPADKS